MDAVHGLPVTAGRCVAGWKKAPADLRRLDERYRALLGAERDGHDGDGRQNCRQQPAN
jgi:hypothetical protein